MLPPNTVTQGIPELPLTRPQHLDQPQPRRLPSVEDLERESRYCGHLALRPLRQLAVGALLRQALGPPRNVDSPASGNGPLIPAGWHTLVRGWDGQQVRQYIDGLRTNTTAVTAAGSWTIYRWGWQFTGSQKLDEAYVPFLGAFAAA